MGEKKQLNVRIPLGLQEKIEKSGRPKVDIVIEALELYFKSYISSIFLILISG